MRELMAMAKLHHNFALVEVEALRLDSLRLPNLEVAAGDALIYLSLHRETSPRGIWVRITPTGEVVGGKLVRGQDGQWDSDGPSCYSGLDAIVRLLQEALEEADNLAKRMGQIVEELAKVTRPSLASRGEV